MTLSELEAQYPALLPYTKNMPEDIRRRCTVRTHPAGSIIHQKDMELHYFGIVATGENRVINEFENGNVYMIETNKPIDFIGEVTILAQMPRTSVTIEAVTETIAAYISRKDAERWLSQDAQILRLVSPTCGLSSTVPSLQQRTKLFLSSQLSSAGLSGTARPGRGHGKRPSAKKPYHRPDKAAPPGGHRCQCKNIEPHHPSSEG